jgi:hypothetical protein
MSPEEAVNQIDRIFQEAVLLHGGDVKKVLNYVKAQIGAANPQNRADIDRVFARVLAFREPDCRPGQFN